MHTAPVVARPGGRALPCTWRRSAADHGDSEGGLLGGALHGPRRATTGRSRAVRMRDLTVWTLSLRLGVAALAGLTLGVEAELPRAGRRPSHPLVGRGRRCSVH